jgi:carbon storage regulator
MLVLTRKSNQSIMIGDEIEISVLSVMGDKVRIGIQAPRSVPVYRREVYVAIQREREDELMAAGPELIVSETDLIAADAQLVTGDAELIAADTSAREHSSLDGT